jgi:hypothetical protein
VIVVNGQILDSSLEPIGGGASADSTLAILRNQHGLVVRWGTSVVNHPHGSQPALPMSVVIGLLAGILFGSIGRNGIEVISILSKLV